MELSCTCSKCDYEHEWSGWSSGCEDQEDRKPKIQQDTWQRIQHRGTRCTRTSPLPLLPSGPGGVGGIASRGTRRITHLMITKLQLPVVSCQLPAPSFKFREKARSGSDKINAT